MPCECQKRQATSQEGRAIDPLRHSKGVVREKPSGKTGNSTENTRAATPADITGSHVPHRLGEIIGERRNVADVKH